MCKRLTILIAWVAAAALGCSEPTRSSSYSLFDTTSQPTAPIRLAGESREAIATPIPYKWSFSMEIPRDPEFQFSLALINPRGDDLGGAQFLIYIESEGKRSRAFKEVLGVGQSNAWHHRQADLTRWSGKSVLFTLEARFVNPAPVPNGVRAAWGEPVLTRGLAASRIRQGVSWYNLWHGDSAAFEKKVADTKFSHDRGFYRHPFTVSITSATPGVTIAYTFDGSEPTPTHGMKGNRVRIERTTVLRAMAYKEGMKPTNIDSHTYIFPATVKDQPKAPPGFPQRIHSSFLRRRQLVTQWYLNHPDHEESVAARRQGPLTAVNPWMDTDAEIDPDIVKGADEEAFIQGLKSIPTLSVAVKVADLFDPERGIYLNHHRRGIEWERRTSVELLYPEGSRFEAFRGFQIDCGLRMHGGLGGNAARKRSFRLLFKKNYGAGKLRYPFFESAVHHAESGAERFDTLILRAGSQSNWSHEPARETAETLMIRDQHARDTELYLSGLSARGIFVHLYLNGIYWGLYNAVERPDQRFLAGYLGGDPRDWYAVNQGGALGDPLESDSHRWDNLHRLAKENDLSDPARYEVMKTLLDTAQFADYIALNWYAGNGDWGEQNWYGAIRIEPPGRGMYLCWDSELTYRSTYRKGSPVAWIDPTFLGSGNFPLHLLWRALVRSPEFRLEFADRVFRACTNGGPLEDPVNRGRFKSLSDYVEPAILCESARWGDSAEGRQERPQGYNQWRQERDLVLDQHMRGNAKRFIEALRAQEYYPAIDPPSLKKSGDRISINMPPGADRTYFTTDGSDPKDAAAVSFVTASKTIPFSPTLRARSKRGKEWSALNVYADRKRRQ